YVNSLLFLGRYRVMKKYHLVILVLMLLLVTVVNLGHAKATIDGTIKAELINDPLAGSRYPTGVKMNQLMKMSLGIRITERRVEAYMPLTIDASDLHINLIADDYMTIPYYFLMRANPFVYSISNSKVGDEKIGFMDFK